MTYATPNMRATLRYYRRPIIRHLLSTLGISAPAASALTAPSPHIYISSPLRSLVATSLLLSFLDQYCEQTAVSHLAVIGGSQSGVVVGALLISRSTERSCSR